MCGSEPARELFAGDTFVITGDVQHTAVALESGCTLIECYSPPRIPAPMEETTK
jgi:hypothetical protein